LLVVFANTNIRRIFLSNKVVVSWQYQIQQTSQ
jgi:hypothetical protein